MTEVDTLATYPPTAIKINNQDNVAVVLQDTKKGDTIFDDIIALEFIPAGHKIALSIINFSENVIKYGQPIGRATSTIQKGAHIHTHNIKTNLHGVLDYMYEPISQAPSPTEKSEKTFMGYKRSDGQVGIRNEIWIVNTVGCVNKTAEKLVREAKTKHSLYTFVHPYGCSQLGDDHVYTQQILAGMVKHPNAGGILVLGLGCENNHIDEFKKIIGDWDDKRVKFLNTQDVDDEIAEGLKIIVELDEYLSTFEREPIPISRLILGLKCGGSDGLSGITANPLVGSLSDRIIASGGTCILTEVPEMFGAETLLMNRCVDETVFSKTVNLINNFKEYFIRYKQEIYENPSPGNKEGGISTLEEKSLGCTQKGGTSQVTDVLNYGEHISSAIPGLVLLQGPGNDIVAVTNLMAAGAHMILFTTGRGTPLGAPIPTVKISSNNHLAKYKPHWIDFNAGGLVEDEDMKVLTDKFLEYLVSVASGDTLAKNEKHDYREISIFKDGVTL